MTVIFKKTQGFKKQIAGISLNDNEWSVLLAIDGSRTTEELAQFLQMPESELSTILNKLSELKLIDTVNKPRTRKSGIEFKSGSPENEIPPSAQSKVPEKTTEADTLPAEIKRSLLYTRNLVKVYGKRTVVNNVSLEVKQGEVVGLLGPNGAGKTTTFYMITGLIRPNKGQIFLDKDDITKLAMYKRARRGIAYLPQEASIFRKLTVEENLIAIIEALKFPKKEQKLRAEELMNDLGITHIAKTKGYNLSGGERRRTEIARTLVNKPKFILLDEPFAGVDPIAVEDIQNIVIQLKAKNIGVLITDHNVHETLSITNHAYLLYSGKILKEGDSEFLANDPEARRLYLGDKFRLER